ncbi:16 kDa beta-galactoside-binding lectin-like isoform X2 [Hemicordylus capensis]|uniref:16 kDa beta-galactoside-binding lectin-like isoform X2 n=1 Tax=Hemicordylus capensis TaxID=884348 RepID=UPI0023036728|nr:16 kDa beta-galactoside-binding lectin-like isoform X2 [Hemicordylus capensis]
MDSQLVLSQLKIKAGDSIKLKGKVPTEAKGFAINLGRDGSDLMLHFNPRFESGGDTRTIVCNSMAGGKWGEEMRESAFPFQQGEEVKICLSFDAKEVTVKMPGDQEIKFPNRLGLESAEFLSVDGDFKTTFLKFDKQ